MKKFLTVSVMAATLMGCSTAPYEFNSYAEDYFARNDFYMAAYEGRTYVLDDAKMWAEFLQFGEPTYRKTMIGEGAKGETLVAGLTKTQAKDMEKGVQPFVAAMEIYKGKLSLSEPLYAEVFDGTRFIVFSNKNDLGNFLTKGEVSGFTAKAAGPHQRDVLYAGLQQSSPALAEQFKLRHDKPEKVSAPE